ncbi:MAG: RNA polymerase sigma factor [Ilumatobacteraceae bacterium]
MNERRERFEAVFREVYEPLQRYARRRTDRVTADDVVAEALLVVWRRLDDLPDGLALPWCYAVARRCLANRRRGDERQARVADRLMGERADVAPEPDPVLAEALDQLDADDREIVRLWAWEQLPPREIAVVLGISANAAAIRVHRAKRRLADAVEHINGKESMTAGHEAVGSTPHGTEGDRR